MNEERVEFDIIGIIYQSRYYLQETPVRTDLV